MAAMSGHRTKLAFCLDVIRAIPGHPKLIPMLAKLAISRAVMAVWCLLAGVTIGDLRHEVELRKQAGVFPADPAAIPKVTAQMVIRDLVEAAVWRVCRLVGGKPPAA
jgi:hypothetical protein